MNHSLENKLRSLSFFSFIQDLVNGSQISLMDKTLPDSYP